MTVNFYLKKKQGNPPRSLVYLQMTYWGQKFIYSARETVDPKKWNYRSQCLKTRSEVTQSKGNKDENFNEYLARLKEAAVEAYNEELSKGRQPEKYNLKRLIDEKVNKSVDDERTLFGLIDKFIAGRMGEQGLGTRKTYQTTKMHLENFQRAEKFAVNFDRIGIEFKNRFVAYLRNEREVPSKKTGKKVKVPGLSANSVAKELKNIRTFMNMALEEGYTENRTHLSKKFSIEKETTAAVYLSDQELRKLFSFDFSDNTRLEAVRDLYIFSSYVGLRYSDASNIKSENIVKRADGKYRIKITPQKTGKPVEIPCNDIVLAIFEKYKNNANRLPPAISGQKYNDYLKELAEIAGLTETGRLLTDPAKPLFQCLTSHSARRNFATNCYLAGVDTRTIMAITGHETEASFNLYLKHTKEQSADKLEEHNERQMSKGKLKAV